MHSEPSIHRPERRLRFSGRPLSSSRSTAPAQAHPIDVRRHRAARWTPRPREHRWCKRQLRRSSPRRAVWTNRNRRHRLLNFTRCVRCVNRVGTNRRHAYEMSPGLMYRCMLCVLGAHVVHSLIQCGKRRPASAPAAVAESSPAERSRSTARRCAPAARAGTTGDCLSSRLVRSTRSCVPILTFPSLESRSDRPTTI